MLPNKKLSVVNRVTRGRHRYGCDGLTVNVVVHYDEVCVSGGIVIGAKGELAANNSDAGDRPVTDRDAEKRKASASGLSRHSLIRDQHPVNVKELHSRVVSRVHIGKYGAKTVNGSRRRGPSDKEVYVSDVAAERCKKPLRTELLERCSVRGVDIAEILSCRLTSP